MHTCQIKFKTVLSVPPTHWQRLISFTYSQFTTHCKGNSVDPQKGLKDEVEALQDD